MLAGAHLIFGNAIAATTTVHPAAAFLIGLISHHLGDYLPHLDSNVLRLGDDFLPLKKWPRKLWLLVIIELVIGLAILLTFWSKFAGKESIIFWASVGSLLPDLISLTFIKGWLLQSKAGRAYLNFHREFHSHLKNFSLAEKVFAGVVEAGVLFLSLILLIGLS